MRKPRAWDSQASALIPSRNDIPAEDFDDEGAAEDGMGDTCTSFGDRARCVGDPPRWHRDRGMVAKSLASDVYRAIDFQIIVSKQFHGAISTCNRVSPETIAALLALRFCGLFATGAVGAI